VSRRVSLSWAKYINEVTKSKVTGGYIAFECVWKTFRTAGVSVRIGSGVGWERQTGYRIPGISSNVFDVYPKMSEDIIGAPLETFFSDDD
jgi:hypothetical protein